MRTRVALLLISLFASGMALSTGCAALIGAEEASLRPDGGNTGSGGAVGTGGSSDNDGSGPTGGAGGSGPCGDKQDQCPNGSCIDVAVGDSNNCGACGYYCESNVCEVDVCVPLASVEGQQQIMALGVGGGRLFFARDSSGDGPALLWKWAGDPKDAEPSSFGGLVANGEPILNIAANAERVVWGWYNAANKKSVFEVRLLQAADSWVVDVPGPAGSPTIWGGAYTMADGVTPGSGRELWVLDNIAKPAGIKKDMPQESGPMVASQSGMFVGGAGAKLFIIGTAFAQQTVIDSPDGARVVGVGLGDGEANIYAATQKGTIFRVKADPQPGPPETVRTGTQISTAVVDTLGQGMFFADADTLRISYFEFEAKDETQLALTKQPVKMMAANRAFVFWAEALSIFRIGHPIPCPEPCQE